MSESDVYYAFQDGKLKSGVQTFDGDQPSGHRLLRGSRCHNTSAPSTFSSV